MKQLITIGLTLAAIFMSLFILIKTTGILTLDDINSGLSAASYLHSIYVALTVIALLFADLFIAVPTLSVSILSGYFLGFFLGGISAMLGMMLAGVGGYMISWFCGPSLLLKIYNDQEKLDEMQDVFSKKGPTVLLICRAVPILPEVSCCLAGANRMSFTKFFFYYSIGTVPYAFIAAWAGSQSSINNPMPAILAAIGIFTFLWLAWFIVLRKNKNKRLAAGQQAS
ncbi:MAG: VTT domain-containing protein [Phycisphaeraceae bacterium]|nr:VTT domain-containing protein [Phycisphaeraceae bacterium]